MAALEGQRIVAVRRRGKFLVLRLERDLILVNPMLTGRLQLAQASDKPAGRISLVLGLGPREGAPADAPSWARRAAWVPSDDATPEIRYRDATSMGKVYVLPAGVDRRVPGWGDPDQGPDADDPDLTLEAWRARIRRHPGELKNLLRNQAFVAGIGNAYSDEILHAARLLPSRKRASLASDEVDELYRATRRTLDEAIGILRERVPPTFERQVRDFLAVHLKGGQPCPRCGMKLSQVSPGRIATSWCRGCQR
jgi:formamidopyrimidine-DNA glycosylase